MPHGTGTPHVLQGDHACERRFYGQLSGVTLGQLQGHLLTVALQLQNPEGRCIGDVVKLVRFLQTRHMRASVLGLGFVLQPIDFTQQRALAQFQFGFGEVAFRFLESGRPLFGITLILSYLLVHLVGQVLIFCVGQDGIVQLLGSIELCHYVARHHLSAVWRKGCQGHLSALSTNLRRLYGEGTDGNDSASSTNLPMRWRLRRFIHRGTNSGGVRLRHEATAAS